MKYTPVIDTCDYGHCLSYWYLWLWSLYVLLIPVIMVIACHIDTRDDLWPPVIKH